MWVRWLLSVSPVFHEPFPGKQFDQKTAWLLRFLHAQCWLPVKPPKADIAERDRHVRFVPKAESCTAAIDPSLRQVFPDFAMS
jgi:hypothetical protein